MHLPGLNKKNDADTTSGEVVYDKPKDGHAEFAMLDNEKATTELPLDYSGAAKKTDPAEIKLVRKLDTWIMPTLWIMYWLNYLDRNVS